MSYCVHCGVELSDTARACPLCHTPVIDPSRTAEPQRPSPFPTKAGAVPPVSRVEAGVLLTVILASISVVCAVLNIFLRAEHIWSLYVIGGALLLWVWLVPPFFYRKFPLVLRLLFDVAAVAVYVLLISMALHGADWYLGLALPIILAAGAVVLFLGLVLPRRSILTSVTLIIGSLGFFALCAELFLDRWFEHTWDPGWSLVVLAISVAIIVPLIIIRRVPSLREEVRRRFHM